MTAIGRPPVWAGLEQALIERRAVQARYHSQQRVPCRHALGWKNGRPKVLSYQASGTTICGVLAPKPRQR